MNNNCAEIKEYYDKRGIPAELEGKMRLQTYLDILNFRLAMEEQNLKDMLVE